MKNKKLTIIALIVLGLVLFTGAFFVVFLNISKNMEAAAKEAEEAEAIDVTSFSAYTKQKIFKDIPAMIVKGAKIGEVQAFGNKMYIIDVNGTTEADYDAYLKVLEKAGFKKHSDNGEDKMEGYAKTASYTKGDITLTVAQALSLDKTYIQVKEKLLLSDHLIYKDEYVANNKPGAKTKLYLMEQRSGGGNSYVIQLKNGNFVLYDGGNWDDTQYLLDFLEELTPGDEKPHIEGWFISHAHGDHHGVLVELATDSAVHKDRITVEGVYFVENNGVEGDGAAEAMASTNVRLAAAAYKNKDGEKTKFYRPQFGQRYYFSDIYIDVSLTCDFYTLDSYYIKDFNDTSMWLKAHIEGQTFFCGGDSSYTGTRALMSVFDKSYGDVTMFSVLHHGINVYDYFTDWINADVALYTTWRDVNPYWEHEEYLVDRREETEHLKESVKEFYHYGNGTVELTFPYVAGSAKTLPKNQWIYHAGESMRTPAD